MKYSLQFSDAIHVLAYIEMFQDTRSLSSEMIASSIETNAANVRKIMSQLKKSGLIFTKPENRSLPLPKVQIRFLY